jgi:hypothetical protein
MVGWRCEQLNWGSCTNVLSKTTLDKVQLQPSYEHRALVTLSYLTNVTNKLTSPIRIYPEEIPHIKNPDTQPRIGIWAAKLSRKTVWCAIRATLVWVP